MFRTVSIIMACAVVASCTGLEHDSGQQNAARLDSVKVAQAGSSRETPRGLCSLFAAAEIGRMLGRAMSEAQVSGPLDTVCQWESPTDEEAYAQVQVIDDTQYWETRSGVRGYETHPDVAHEAFTAPELGGWVAGALTDSRVVFISVNGGNSSRELALEMLRTALRRLEQ
jgi:hypothetical protein